ncbi:hypothetical protein M5362_30535 [Streptomyces sp. Je 1-79]|uniref:restriction endonuclease fold toxin-2 domain-containing protein n=1 Tax=Streptomyces sp. Je 1-79 TaxID=2943847 RepID=UPI0021A881D0|nr:restriction endonuclease fold toxin-2 domain-containing protein [Streptomyces sp. Je 1-79]MCT4357445.1 hypothetical protein [Streptomyces sp. Je 1-79]
MRKRRAAAAPLRSRSRLSPGSPSPCRRAGPRARDPGCPPRWSARVGRSLDELRANHQSGKKDFLYDKDRKELTKYNAALNDPRNKEMRGVETVTNNADSMAYWRVMMAAYGVKGYARYVP